MGDVAPAAVLHSAMLARGSLVLLLTALASPAHAGDLPLVDAYVERKMADHRIPGLALVVVRDGAVVHTRGFGEMTPSSPIVIGSLSKAFTATAILQLADAGKLDLDAPVRTYLPAFELADAAAATLTVRQLLHQTGGLPGNAPRSEKADASLEDHVRALRTVRLVAAPGAKHIYSSPNYQVLGLTVEVVSGEAFGGYVQRHIFAPLKMTHSRADRGGDVTPGHNLWWGLKGPTAYRWEAGRLPTASLVSSAEDLGRFVLAHLNGGELDGARILSAESTATAHRGVGPAEGFTYAMGWREGTTAGVPSLWHGGALPCYRGALVLLPGTRSGVVVLTNSASPFVDHTREIAAGVVALMNDRPVPTGIRPLRLTYLVIAAASILLVGLQLRGLWRAARGERHTKGPLPVVLLDLVLPVTLLVLIPRMAHVGWRDMLESAPDLVVTTVLLLAISIVRGVVRLARRERVAAA